MGPGVTKEVEARVIIGGDKEICPGLSSSTEERDILNKTDELRGVGGNTMTGIRTTLSTRWL